MMRRLQIGFVAVTALVGAAIVWPAETVAQRRGSPPAASVSATKRETPKTTCPAVAGVGVNTKRRYCEVRIAEVVEDGIRIELPARTGAATLRFDLHSRFAVSGGRTQASRQDALVALVGPDGGIIERAVVRGELRTSADLFDRLVAAGRGTTVATAPGVPEHVRVSIPAGAAFVALVGLRQDVQLMNRSDRYETPGRPIALVSNFDVTYTPARAR